VTDQSKQLFLIFGDDDFLVERKCQEIVDRITSSAQAPLFVQKIDLEETEATRLAEELSTPSLFGSSIIIAKHFSISPGSRILSYIESIFENPVVPGKSFILLPERVDKRLKAYRLIEEQATVLEIKRLDRDGLIRWIIGRFGELGKVASPQVAELLVELKGEEDTRLIDSEIEKLIAYIGDKKEVARADVEAVVGELPTDRVFELIGKVAKKDRLGALDAFEGLMQIGESPTGIVILLSREVRWLIQVHLYLRDRARKLRANITYSEFSKSFLEDFGKWIEEVGISEKDTFIGQKPYAVYMRFVEAVGFQIDYLIDLLDRLLEINTLLVSTSMNPRVLLEMLLASIGEQ